MTDTQWLGFVALAVAAFAAASRSWRVLAAVLALMALAVARDAWVVPHAWADAALRANGDYAVRRTFQAALIVAVLLGAAGVLPLLRRLRPAPRVAAVATLALALVLLLQAISLPAIDHVLAYWIGPVRAIGLMWLAGALVVTGAAWRDGRQSRGAAG